MSSHSTDPTQEGRVKAIFDHHDDDHHHQSASPRIIREPNPVADSAGSCTSIIADYFHTRFPPASSLAPHSAWSDVATLLLSAIAIDTNGLKAGGKAQNVDRTAGEFLYPISAFGALSISGDGTPNPESKTIPDLTKILSHRKGDVSGLPGQDLLRRDYKEYSYTTTNASQVRVGLSSVPMSLDKWLKRDGAATFWADQDAWITKQGLAVSGVLCAFKTKEKEHKREMLLVFSSSASTALEGRLYAGLEGNTDLDVARRDLDGLVE
ncbi:hypothetical protein BDV93DRAFT_566955, partial [Ceratobasidium sp. AG-I]